MEETKEETALQLFLVHPFLWGGWREALGGGPHARCKILVTPTRPADRFALGGPPSPRVPRGRDKKSERPHERRDKRGSGENLRDPDVASLIRATLAENSG
jgi:hypothetical protein